MTLPQLDLWFLPQLQFKIKGWVFSPKQEVSSEWVCNFENWNVQQRINISEIKDPCHIPFSGLGRCSLAPAHIHFKPSWKDSPSNPSLCSSHPELHISPASPVSLIADISCLLSSSKLCSSLCPLTSLFLPSDQHLFPNFPNPAPNTIINFWKTHSIAFSAHQPLPPGRMSLLISASPPYKSSCLQKS